MLLFRSGLLHTAYGTPAYTAPEVVRRRGYDGARANAWSCGAILLVFLAGSLPFNDSNLPNMYQKIYHREFNMPDWISKPARNLIYRLLDPNPITRMSIEDMMSNNWFKRLLKSDPQIQLLDSDLANCEQDSTMNAFDIFSMSFGLELSRLFEEGLGKKEQQFTAATTMAVIEERVSERMESGREAGRRCWLVSLSSLSVPFPLLFFL
ncbi:hypothetical protein LguiA_028784 [Lonicera macranthoides]